ncbi:activator of Hsp90 ATPase-like protein [Jatrophihabitans sp. GAS493]|uniref:SRPBCC family protein n=1 Tax=Jatrophihabitans sp. GAS493 TaxID=1907575 RepID=UPI000BB89A5A|nr:SRPBCC domain-containing protein [Jatrophihabitans sp. GAS493]SOD73937.1 activator of Hsp90 ATPase-like protein [Jatrophihabitans sp. GAS493]
MNDTSFTTSWVVDQTPQEVFDAIVNVRGWWSAEIEGGSDALGDVFTYRYQDIHRSRQQVTELVPGKKVAWRVLDGYLSFTREKSEWTGTEVVFDVAELDGQTELRFTHIGLVPEFECYDRCRAGWSFYIDQSLRGLITTGQGSPNGPE